MSAIFIVGGALVLSLAVAGVVVALPAWLAVEIWRSRGLRRFLGLTPPPRLGREWTPWRD